MNYVSYESVDQFVCGRGREMRIILHHHGCQTPRLSCKYRRGHLCSPCFCVWPFLHRPIPGNEVSIMLPGDRRILTLCEVRVFAQGEQDCDGDYTGEDPLPVAPPPPPPNPPYGPVP